MKEGMSVLRELDEAARFVESRTRTRPVMGVVLGSGLGAWAEGLHGQDRIPYGEIPHMPSSTVAGHPGNLCLGSASRGGAEAESGAEDVPVACLQGRVHLYEGHPLERVVFGVRLLARLGCRAVLLTNAAGGLDPAFSPGDLMLILDHLNLTGHNPLIGPNEPALGPRFPDMTDAYDPALREAALAASRDADVALHQGVYAGLLGPNYETPAEIRMLHVLGASAVGMSTVPEVIALRHMGVRVAAVSCITNLAAGLSPTKLDHSEVEATAARTRASTTRLLSAWVRRTAAVLAGEAQR
jgi:purine-nucleoside phosphorylase